MQRTIYTWLRSHKTDVVFIGVLLAIAGLVSVINFAQYPMRFEDEGTYVSQAWAVQYWGDLAHYTYWYDHPPLGWLQMALYTTATFAFERYESAITAGREFMIVLHLISVALVYAIARRLQVGKLLALVAGGLFALSPLAVEFSRLVLLDNIALPWMLGAFFLALSPRKHLATVAGSAICFGLAVLSKETFLIFLPALLYLLYQQSDRRNRQYAFTVFGVVFFMVGASYILYAVLKGELFPGEGHVSLLGTVWWQLFGRVGSGSILDPSSNARGLLELWLQADPWLLGLGAVLTPIAFIRRRFRPVGLALLIGILMMLRTGYLPYPYVISLLPFAALMIACGVQTFIGSPLLGRQFTWRRQSAEVASVVAALVFVIFVAPSWQAELAKVSALNADHSSRQAVAWVAENVPHNKRLVVESALWSDLEVRGFDDPDPVWLYKTETDPEIVEELGGWRGIDYLMLNGPTLDESSRDNFPTIFEAKDHAKVVAEFGQDQRKVVVMKVDN